MEKNCRGSSETPNHSHSTSNGPHVVEIKHMHLFAGLGGGARGFNQAAPRVGNLQAKFRCLGGIDVDAASIRDFERMTGTKGTVLDLFDRDQYRDFHGVEPPAGWREATPQDIQRAAGNETPNCCFLSAPCKGFSGLLAEGKSKTAKYQALNRLTLRGIWLMLEAWADDCVELIVFENVPRIATRGRHLLDQINAILRHYGYIVSETTHDCGELGGLAQSRKRFLLVARHAAKIPNFLYQPDSRPLRAVGEVLGRMPLPGDLRAGPMHRIPALMWKTWLRLAFVEAGGDWRSLNKLAVHDGKLKDFLIVPEMHAGVLGVNHWDAPMGTVTGKGRPTNGAFAVADHRFEGTNDYGQYGVCGWDQTMGAVINVKSPGQGKFAVSDPRTEDTTPASLGMHGVDDPRLSESATRQYNLYRVINWNKPANVVAGSAHVGGGALSVADPRQQGDCFGKYAVTDWRDSVGNVISGSTTGQGAFAVADPRHADTPASFAAHEVLKTGIVEEQRNHPAANQHLVARIRSMDGTWHRPFTTLELAALQSLVNPEDQLELDGLSDQAWRERIGNAVPPAAAQAIAHVMGTTLLLAWSGETFSLSSQSIWVKPIALALCVGGADVTEMEIRHGAR